MMMNLRPDFNLCAICGISLDRPEGWNTDVIALSGPHWPHRSVSSPSLMVHSHEVSRHATKPGGYHGALILLPQEREIYTHFPYYLNKESCHSSEWEGMMYLGLHAACEDLADRAIKNSYKASLRSVGDLWLTLERRGTRQKGMEIFGIFTPGIPENLPGQPFSIGLGRYFVPSHIIKIQLSGDYEDGWWNENPIKIPNLTTLLIANLKIEKDVSGELPKSLSGFQKRFERLPQELKNLVCSFLHQYQLPLECTYIMPQSTWRQVFFQIPFLWDLNIKEIHDKTSVGDFGVQNWDWEKITRQVVAPPEVTPQYLIGAWSYEKVGLSVPGGFTNRRRIWQILEEMYPNDVRH